MTPQLVFSIVSPLAMMQWLLLIVVPKSKINQWLINHAAVPLVLSIIYCIYIIGFFQIKGGGFASIAEVRTLFNNNNLLLAGWVHYLAFDLLTGFALLKSAQERGLSRWVIIPCLLLTFLFGPAGYLYFRVYCFIKLRK